MNAQLVDRKEDILISTLNLIQEYGFHGTPISQVAQKAKVSVGTVYHYFQSKDELILELFSFCKLKMNDYIFHDLQENQEYEHFFKNVCRRFVHFYLEFPEYFKFMDQFIHPRFTRW